MSLQDKFSPITTGCYLLADPSMDEGIFSKAVILLCEHNSKGSVGFILNKPIGLQLSDLFSVSYAEPIFIHLGGPVQTDTIHFIHTFKDLKDSYQLSETLFWGGDLDYVLENPEKYPLNSNNCKFFIGYSGWGATQLETEFQRNYWLVNQQPHCHVFNTPSRLLWDTLIYLLGKEYYGYLFYPDALDLN